MLTLEYELILRILRQIVTIMCWIVVMRYGVRYISYVLPFHDVLRMLCEYAQSSGGCSGSNTLMYLTRSYEYSYEYNHPRGRLLSRVEFRALGRFGTWSPHLYLWTNLMSTLVVKPLITSNRRAH